MVLILSVMKTNCHRPHKTASSSQHTCDCIWVRSKRPLYTQMILRSHGVATVCIFPAHTLTNALSPVWGRVRPRCVPQCGTLDLVLHPWRITAHDRVNVPPFKGTSPNNEARAALHIKLKLVAIYFGPARASPVLREASGSRTHPHRLRPPAWYIVTVIVKHLTELYSSGKETPLIIAMAVMACNIL